MPSASAVADSLPVRRVGRKRSEASRSQVLAAAYKMLESQTIQEISIEAIAREAGVGKTTIYRWWESKALVVIDAFVEHHVLKTPMRHDLPPAEAVALHVISLVHEYAGWSGRIIGQIVAEGQSDPAVLRELRERFHYSRRAMVRETLERWRSKSKIPTPPNIEILGDLIYAPIYMRLLLGHAPLDDAFAIDHLTYVYTLLKVPVPDFKKLVGMKPPAARKGRKTAAVAKA